MKKSTGIVVAVVAVIALGFWYFTSGTALAPKQVTGDYKTLTYTVEGQLVELVAGRAETPSAPGSASKTVTVFFGNEATGDLNGDGMPDVAFILTQNTGGSGTFYYVAVALKTKDGYRGTNAVLLGDRVAPQTTEIKEGKLTVNYAERKRDEPMTAQPSVAVSKYLQVTGDALSEVPRIAQ